MGEGGWPRGPPGGWFLPLFSLRLVLPGLALWALPPVTGGFLVHCKHVLSDAIRSFELPAWVPALGLELAALGGRPVPLLARSTRVPLSARAGAWTRTRTDLHTSHRHLSWGERRPLPSFSRRPPLLVTELLYPGRCCGGCRMVARAPLGGWGAVSAPPFLAQVRELEPLLGPGGSPCRLIWTSSRSARKASFCLEDMQHRRGREPYSSSKYAVDLLSVALNRHGNGQVRPPPALGRVPRRPACARGFPVPAPRAQRSLVPAPGPLLQRDVPGDHDDQPDLRDPAPLRVDPADARHMAGECAPAGPPSSVSRGGSTRDQKGVFAGREMI